MVGRVKTCCDVFRERGDQWGNNLLDPRKEQPLNDLSFGKKQERPDRGSIFAARLNRQAVKSKATVIDASTPEGKRRQLVAIRQQLNKVYKG